MNGGRVAGKNVDVRAMIFDHPRRGEYEVIEVMAGPKAHRGGRYAGAPVETRRDRIEVYVSPTGRSVQVYVNGERVS